MKRALVSVSTIVLLFGLILCGQAFGQSPETPPVFDVADVHSSKPGTTEVTSRFMAAGRVELRGATMLDLVSIAYQVGSDLVIGGPTWLDTDRFDISARAAPTTQQDALRPMLQVLLADRFNLAIRKEERPLPIFALMVGKRGLKLKESAGDGPSRCTGSGEGTATFTATCQHLTMAQLAQRLPGMGSGAAGGYLDHPVVDMTGLASAYDLSLSFTRRGQLRRPAGDTDPGSGISIFDAVDQQLGLKLEAREQPGTVIVVEHVNQKPTDNPAGVTHTPPPPPTEFEVAEIRPSRPGTIEGTPRYLQSGRFELPGTTLKSLITLAYDVEDDRVVGAPKWWDTDHFDLVAKTETRVPIVTLQPILQKLLVERFKLAVHQEEQPVSVYALTAGKRGLKLKEADGALRSSCKDSLGDGRKIYTCQNTTMEQLAGKLRSAAPLYIDHAVVDLTGLKGSYDFTLSWATKGRFTAAGRGGGDTGQPSGGVAAASDPNGDITVFEAVDKYLGLKLAAQKYPMSVVVIDHVERTPTEN